MNHERSGSVRIVVFDVETTGLGKGDEVVQFSALVLDEHFKSISATNFYCNTQVQMSSGAFAVHGLTKADIFQLSEGTVFEDNWLKFLESLEGHRIVWVPWNVAGTAKNGFDERIIDQTLANNGLEEYFHFPRYSTIGECLKENESVFNLMYAVSKKFGKTKMKLEVAVNTLPYKKEQINKVYDRLVLQIPNVNYERRYHNAMYDAFVTYLLFSYYFGGFNE